MFEQKFILVTGKGGSGKSTLALAIAHRLSAQGRKVLLAEMGRKKDLEFCSLPRLLGLPKASHKPQRVTLPSGHSLDISVLDPTACLAEYVDLKLPTRGLAGVILNNSVTAAFLEAIPGLPDLVTLGKLWYALEKSKDPSSPDTVILDAPSTGHALAMLHAPGNFRKITKAGPLFKDAKEMEIFFQDPKKFLLCLTSLAEEMSIQESLEFCQKVKEFPKPEVFVGKLFPSLPSLKLQEGPVKKAYEYSFRRAKREQESLKAFPQAHPLPFLFPDSKKTLASRLEEFLP